MGDFIKNAQPHPAGTLEQNPYKLRGSTMQNLSVGRHFQRHRLVACRFPTHWKGVKDAIRYNPMRTYKYQIREHPQNMRLGNMLDDLGDVHNHFFRYGAAPVSVVS